MGGGGGSPCVFPELVSSGGQAGASRAWREAGWARAGRAQEGEQARPKEGGRGGRGKGGAYLLRASSHPFAAPAATTHFHGRPRRISMMELLTRLLETPACCKELF